MSFDAGTIIARLDLEDSDFDRKLRRDVEKIEAFERGDHSVKLEPSVDTAAAAAADARLAEESRDREVKLVPKVDDSAGNAIRNSMRRLDQGITRDAEQRLRGGGGSILGMLHGLFSGRGLPGISTTVGKNLAAALSTSGGQSGAAGIASAAGPGMGLLGAKPAALIGAGVLGLGALPALGGVLSTSLGGAVGLGGAAFLGGQAISQNLGPALQAYQQAQNAMQMAVTPQQRLAAQRQMQGAQQFAQRAGPGGASVFRSISGLQNDWQNFTGSLLPALARPLHQIVPMVESLFGPLRRFFTDSMTVVEPFVRALVGGVKEILPLLGQLARASGPGFAELTRGLFLLVKDMLPGLITMSKAATPVMKIFSQALGDFGRDFGKMFAVMAPAVRPSMIVLKALLDAVGGLLPVIGRIATVMARALAPVIPQIALAFRLLAPALVQVGRILGELGGAILVDLAQMLVGIARLVGGLAPSFKIFANVLGQVFTTLESAGVMGALASALEQLAPLIAQVINAFVRQLMPVLPLLINLWVQLGTILVDLVAAGLTTVLKFVLAVIDHSGWLIKALGLITAAWLAWNLVMAVSPLGAIIFGIVAVIGAITLLATHWHRVWTDVKNWAMDAWQFLTHGWGQWLVPGLTLIRTVVELVRDHWKQAWDDIVGAAQSAWHLIWNDIIQPMIGVFTNDVPNAFKTAVHWIGQHWHDIEQVVADPVGFVINTVLDGLIKAFDWITSKLGLGKPISTITIPGLASGGVIPGYGGGDRHLALLEGGEAVLSKETTASHAAQLSAWGVPGMQQGGIVPHAGMPAYGVKPQHRVGQHGPGLLGGLFHGIGHALSSLFHKAVDIGKISAAIATGNTAALTNAVLDLIGGNRAPGASAGMAQMLLGMGHEAISDVVSWLIGHGGIADGNNIVKFAMSYLGKIPYTWGGTTLSGDDCSGFVMDVYNHFGIHPPRTSEAQGAWVKRSGPVPGGLAFYVSSGGGPPPGHVAIIRTPTQVISQGGPEGVKGPTLMPLHGMPLMFTGIPPMGLGGVGLGPQNLRQIEGYWMQAGGPGGMIAHIAAAITGAEAGFRPGAVQQGQPYATTGWGLWQITPGNSEPQFGINQALLNPLNNARAAVAKWRGAGDSFSPWTTYTSGAYQRFMDGGGWWQPGMAYANATGQPEAVLNPQQSDAFVALAQAAHALSRRPEGGSDRLLERLIKAVEANAGQTADGLAAVLDGTARKAIYRSAYEVR